MKTAEITLPSGLSGVVRNWKMGELSVFSSRSMMKKPGPAIEAELMRKAWMETLDTGPYAFAKSPPWMSGIATGDLFDAVRHVRMLTWGDDMDLDFECKRDRCGELIPVTIDLAALEIKQMTEDNLANFANGNRFTYRLPESGIEVTFGISTGTSQVRADNLARELGRDLTAVRASRILAVEGIEKPNSKAFWNFVSELDADDGMALGDAMDEIEPGVETDVVVECESCGHRQVHTVTFGADFFMPERSEKRKKAETDQSIPRQRIPSGTEQEEKIDTGDSAT